MPSEPSSPLQRARRTAELAGIDASVDDDLVEWDYGGWEGRTTAQIRQERADPGWTIWRDPVPPGRDTPGEQAAEVAVRADRVLDRCRPVLQGGGDCILVAHGHLLRILTATWLGSAPLDGRLYALEAAGVGRLGFEHEQPVITRWNC